jgi:integrase
MSDAESNPNSADPWQKTNYANLIRYKPSGIYFARIRVKGKLIRKSLKTDALTVAKLRLADLEKSERQKAESQENVTRGKLSFGEAVAIYRQRIAGDVRMKPRTKEYYGERLAALLKSWPELEDKDIARLTKTECLNWAANFAQEYSPTAFNNTVKILRDVIEIGIESGARYDSPASTIKRASVRPKKMQLPEASKFEALVSTIKTSGVRFSKPCADLVQFLAYGGFRKSEAANVLWQDCNFERGEITVKGDPETGLKGRQIGESRVVPMIPDMRKLLERIKADRPDEKPETPVMRVRECQQSINRASKILGIKRITHHDLRHLFATRCIESGVDIPTVSRWLGHKDGGALAMKTYGHLRNEHSQQMAQKVRFSATDEQTTTVAISAA